MQALEGNSPYHNVTNLFVNRHGFRVRGRLSNSESAYVGYFELSFEAKWTTSEMANECRFIGTYRITSFMPVKSLQPIKDNFPQSCASLEEEWREDKNLKQLVQDMLLAGQNLFKNLDKIVVLEAQRGKTSFQAKGNALQRRLYFNHTKNSLH